MTTPEHDIPILLPIINEDVFVLLRAELLDFPTYEIPQSNVSVRRGSVRYDNAIVRAADYLTEESPWLSSLIGHDIHLYGREPRDFHDARSKELAATGIVAGYGFSLGVMAFARYVRSWDTDSINFGRFLYQHPYHDDAGPLDERQKDSIVAQRHGVRDDLVDATIPERQRDNVPARIFQQYSRYSTLFGVIKDEWLRQLSDVADHPAREDAVLTGIHPVYRAGVDHGIERAAYIIHKVAVDAQYGGTGS
jgi:hypothetical protein